MANEDESASAEIPEPPTGGGRSSASVWTTRISVVIAIIALGTSIYMALLAKAAEDRAEAAEEKSQAQFVSHYFEMNSNGGLDRLIVQNRGQMPISDVVVNLKESQLYVRFDQIPGCKQQRVEPLVVDALNTDNELERYDLTGSSTVSIQFVDDQGVAWEKSPQSGLRTIDKPGSDKGAVDVTAAFSRNQAHYLEDVPTCS
ncbi:hypothetical protein [Streptomyces sp. NPDC001876]|uniref:hypothetical protein n=1 Tax=Streptomyces sp. NPDC001876 TaxID=3154402 RepID=UPI00331F08B6